MRQFQYQTEFCNLLINCQRSVIKSGCLSIVISPQFCLIRKKLKLIHLGSHRTIKIVPSCNKTVKQQKMPRSLSSLIYITIIKLMLVIFKVHTTFLIHNFCHYCKARYVKYQKCARMFRYGRARDFCAIISYKNLREQWS